MSNLLYYHEALKEYSKGSHKKVIFPCPTCNTENIRTFKECHGKKRCKSCYHGKKELTYEESLKILAPKSGRKVLFTCNNCKKQSQRAFNNCHNAKYCKYCYSEEINKNQRPDKKIETFEEAYLYSQLKNKPRTQLKISIKCYICKIIHQRVFGDLNKDVRNKEENYICINCQGIKLSDTKLLDTAKKHGYNSYREFSKAVIKYLEDTGYGPGSMQTLIHFNSTRMVLDNVIKRANRPDLITNNSTSSVEKHLVEYIKSIYDGKIIENDRSILSPKEVDIYLPELNIAIEYNGLWWHSEKFVERKYHYNKYKECKDQGIKLYNIWSHIYNKNPEAVKQFIKNLIIPKERIYARKCKITMDKEKIKEFIKNNHLQGHARSHTYIGLEYNNELVMAISISDHHRKGKKVQVLNRVCFSKYNVVGGLNKLLKLVDKPLITWSDHCYSPTGDMYLNAGFEKDAELDLDYFYSDLNCNYTSKQSQSKKSSKCPENMTESEWANKRGLFKVWDCGKTRWILNIP